MLNRALQSSLPWIRHFANGLIRQTAGVVIVGERQQPPMESLHDGSYNCKPLFAVGTTYTVSVSEIQGAVHLVLLTPQPDSMWWYLSNTIDLNHFNLFDM